MNRTSLIGSFVFIAAVIGARVLHVEMERAAFAEQRVPTKAFYPDARPFDPFTPAPPTLSRVVKVPRVVYEEVHTEASQTDRRSQEYSALMLQKAQRMSEEELDQAIADAKAELDAQNEAADQQLQQAVVILEQLVEQSAGTPAADRARLSLSVLKSQVPTPQLQGPVPRPDVDSLPTY